MSQLFCTVEKQSDISPALTGEMFELLRICFSNVRQQTFLEDLQNKDEVFLLRAANGKLCGFSTAVLFRHRLNMELSEHRVVFSGDTVISPEHWGSLELPIVWGKRMLELFREEPQTPLYWMLISKGIRTYKFLPTFFKEFYPNAHTPTPDGIQELMHSLGALRFPDQYSPASGLIEPLDMSYYLRSGLAHVPSIRSEKPHTKFFLSANPHYRSGAELLCLCKFCPENLHPFILREIERRRRLDGENRDAA